MIKSNPAVIYLFKVLIELPENVGSLFRINNEDTRMTLTMLWCFHCYI